jgi:ribonuclease HII
MSTAARGQFGVLIAGVDEAGRGPLAGPVCAAAVILAPDSIPEGIDDSKRLSAAHRERLSPQIKQQALCWSVEWASALEIDRLNILWASLLAMRRAVAGLRRCPSLALIDGNRCPDGLPCPSRAVIGGDALEPAISAASILAKVARDQLMQGLDAQYPDYGFARHKGYPTKQHLEALRRHGPCVEHRRSFRPVRLVLGSDERAAPGE